VRGCTNSGQPRWSSSVKPASLQACKLDKAGDLGYCKILKRRNNMDNKDYTRRNRFNGESVELTPEEAKKHDEIFYYEALATLEDKKAGIDGTSKLWDKVRSNLSWFRQHNAKAYMVLLD